jgi:hypothetical protein
LHFTFDVEDSDIVVSEDWKGESTLDGEDRVEIFFAKDAALAEYWCIEIDSRGRVHDYFAKHYRKFDSDWNCPGIKAEGSVTPTGYTVRASIPLKVLADLLGRPIVAGSEIRIGLFRAEFYGKQPATHGESDDNWISWVKPDSKKPDFHIPSAFRTWRLPGS